MGKVALHALKHPEDILSNQVVGELRLKVETAETWHKRINLHDGLRFLVVHRIQPLNIKLTGNLFFDKSLLLLVQSPLKLNNLYDSLDFLNGLI